MPNRLARETSPYLLQHADNPVDWYPWGDEAFERARRQNRPLMLSVGYSSCHWCHVMERESFEDEATASLMNDGFVSVKVDREERPDVDQVYMRAVQAMTGRGGWPLTVFLTPEGEPFYGGTYFPPEPRSGMPSFRQILEAVLEAYHNRTDDVRASARGLVDALRTGTEETRATTLEPPDAAVLDGAAATLTAQFDARNGGFGGAPKFPQPVTLELLMRHHVRTGDRNALDMVLHTLRHMAAGGIRDHLGGGFHRYSVDARWRVPHFEKMLYDNALLARAYTDAFRLTGAQDLKDVATETLEWILSDLGAPEGGFYAAWDADSEGEEGRFYVWSREQVTEVLGPERAELFARCYGVGETGDFEGANVLHLPRSIEAAAVAEALTPDELSRRLADARRSLLEARGSRVPPLRDDKILLGWNGLAVRALAEAGGALSRDDWVGRAVRAADFLLEALRRDGALLHTWKDGVAGVPAFLDDHAALGNALLSLHEATLDPRWLVEARWICEEVRTRFWSEEEGVFYDAAKGEERLPIRPRDPMDNATPSGTSLAVELMLRAGHVFGKSGYDQIARRALASEGPLLERYGPAFGRLLSALDRSLAPPVEIAVVGDPSDARTRALLRTALLPWLPNRTVAGRGPEEAAEGVPVLEGRGMRDGSPTAYFCRAYACLEPVTRPEALAHQIEEANSHPLR